MAHPVTLDCDLPEYGHATQEVETVELAYTLLVLHDKQKHGQQGGGGEGDHPDALLGGPKPWDPPVQEAGDHRKIWIGRVWTWRCRRGNGRYLRIAGLDTKE